MTDEEKREKAQHFNLELETARYNMSGSDSELVDTAIRKAMEKNWALINGYLVITLVGLVGSYYLTGLWSLTASVVVNVAAFFTGSRMTRDVIIITRTIR